MFSILLIILISCMCITIYSFIIFMCICCVLSSPVCTDNVIDTRTSQIGFVLVYCLILPHNRSANLIPIDHVFSWSESSCRAKTSFICFLFLCLATSLTLLLELIPIDQVFPWSESLVPCEEFFNV